MNYEGDPEDALYAQDRKGRLLRLTPTHTGEVADSLRRLAIELEKTKTDLSAWKWTIILAHNAAQNTFADAIPHEASTMRADLRSGLDKAANATTDTEREQGLAEYLAALARRIRDDDPTGDLLKFMNLWDMVRSVRSIRATGDENANLKRLNRERNKFIHLGGEVPDFDLRDYPKLVLTALEVIEFLGWRTGLMNWWRPQVKQEARAALDRCIQLATELDGDYAT